MSVSLQLNFGVIFYKLSIKYTQLYRFSRGEYFREIRDDLIHLQVLGVEIESITCDGLRPTLKAIKKVYPDVIIQRCVVHIQKMANALLRQKPITQASYRA